MHLKPFLFSTHLYILPILRPAGIGQVNGANLALTEETQKDDSNVEEVTFANALLKSQVCPQLIQRVSASLTHPGGCQ